MLRRVCPIPACQRRVRLVVRAAVPPGPCPSVRVPPSVLGGRCGCIRGFAWWNDPSSGMGATISVYFRFISFYFHFEMVGFF